MTSIPLQVANQTTPVVSHESGQRQPQQQSLPLDSPSDFYRRLHFDQRRSVWVWHPAIHGPRGGTHSKITPKQDGPAIVAKYAGERDVYLTVSEFTGWLCLRDLATLRACHIDIDAPDVDAHTLIEQALDLLQTARIPPPTFAVKSGGGIHLYWVLERGTPVRALVYWKAIQNRLIDVLAPLGVDAGASGDATRVMRMPGTLNMKRGDAMTRGQEVSGATWSLDDLGREVLPWSRAQVRDYRAAAGARRNKRDNQSLQKRQGKLGIQGWWFAVYQDLHSIVDHHWGEGGVEAGHRDTLLYLLAVALSYFVHYEALWAEIRSTAHRLTPSLSDTEIDTYTKPVVSRARQEGIDVKSGEPRNPKKHRYRFKRKTLRRWLQGLITPDLEPHLVGLASDDQLAVRKRQRDRARSADHYTGEGVRESNQAKRDQAASLVAAGWSRRAVARELGVTMQTVRLWLQARQKRGD